MRNVTKAAGLLFLAASSVFAEGVLRAAGDGKPKAKASQVKPLDNATDIFADPAPPPPSATLPASQPATQPLATQPVSAQPLATQPATAATPSTQPAGPAAAPSAQTVAVRDAGTVEVHVNEANLVEVLKMLSIQSQKNIIASKDVHGTVNANLYDVTIKEALDAILKVNGYDYREKGNFIYVYTAKELADQEKLAVLKKTEMFRLYYTPAINAANMIKPALSNEGAVSFTAPAKTGIDSDGKDVGGNDHATEDLLVVTDYPERLDQVRAVLKEVDRRPQQILVEAVILRATLQENNDLGIDFTALGGVDFNTLGPLGAGATASTASGVDQLLGGDILNNTNAGGVTDHGAVAARAGGSGLKMGFVKNNIGVFLSALEGVTDTVVMANPKVLVLNKQKGEVHVGSEQGYRTAIATETLTADDVKFLETGTRLSFRPYVGDNGFIRMEIHPEDSSGSVNAAGLPNKSLTQITSNVMVRDGHTIVIGGLFREATTRTRSQVPGLGSLPGVGAAFRHQTDDTVREEVIILLTPHIVKDESAYSDASEEQLKEADRIRVGMRKGLMPFGRERLAEAWYEKAQDELRKDPPDRQKALWYLNSATNLNPMFTEAISLKVRVTGVEATSSDNSSVRTFLTKMVLSEKGKDIKYPSDTPPIVVPPLTSRSAHIGDKVVAESVAAGPTTQRVAAVADNPSATSRPTRHSLARPDLVTQVPLEPASSSDPQK